MLVDIVHPCVRDIWFGILRVLYTAVDAPRKARGSLWLAALPTDGDGPSHLVCRTKKGTLTVFVSKPSVLMFPCCGFLLQASGIRAFRLSEVNDDPVALSGVCCGG